MKVTLLLSLLFASTLPARAQKPDAKEWGVADHFKNLPGKYITASGDFARPSAETLVVDEKNGYAAAYMTSPPRAEADDEAFPTFEMALFKSRTKPPLLVVSNTKSDSVCTDYESFFLRRVGDGWTEVRREVVPPLELKMFWDRPQSAARFLKIVERDNATSLHFQPPRHGTRMKVSLEICDHFLDVAPLRSVDELRKLIESARPIYLTWDRQAGKFYFAK